MTQECAMTLTQGYTLEKSERKSNFNLGQML